MSGAHWWKDGVFDKTAYLEHVRQEEEKTKARKAIACCKTLYCGGWCRLEPRHEGPCLCDGDTDGPDTCPA